MLVGLVAAISVSMEAQVMHLPPHKEKTDDSKNDDLSRFGRGHMHEC